MPKLFGAASIDSVSGREREAFVMQRPLPAMLAQSLWPCTAELELSGWIMAAAATFRGRRKTNASVPGETQGSKLIQSSPQVRAS